MPTLRHVWFWPAMGHPDRPWMAHPDEDAFARAANSVCELYSEAVQRAGIPVRHSELRLFCRHDGRREDVLVEVHPDVTEGFEMAVASLPPGIATLAPPARAGLVLEVVHAAALRLAQARGWDTAGLCAAHAHTLGAGLRYRWDGPPKTSPDRRHVAHPRYVLGDDGYGRVIVQVRRRDDNALVCASPVAAVRGSSRSFAEHARTVRWRSKTLVQFQPADGISIGPTGTISGNDYRPVTLDLTDPTSFGNAIELGSAEYHDRAAMAGIPTVVVKTPTDAGSRIEVIGGGPMNDVPHAYTAALERLLQQLNTPQWQTWWSAAERDVLEILYSFDATTIGVTARHTRDTLRTTIRRPASTFAGVTDHAATARQDVEAMLAAVRRRAGLGNHPPLSD